MKNSTFINNTAVEAGGAIAYDLYPPELEDNYFVNNTAVYGPDIASYPYKIRRDTDLDSEYVSG